MLLNERELSRITISAIHIRDTLLYQKQQREFCNQQMHERNERLYFIKNALCVRDLAERLLAQFYGILRRVVVPYGV